MHRGQGIDQTGRMEKWRTGIPGAQFCDVIDGVWSTLNIMESDANKQLIAEKAQHDAQKIDIKYHYNYYMDC